MKRPARPGEFPDWEKLYREEEVESMPWFHIGLDPDLTEAIDALGMTGGTVLDIGTGPGTQAIALAELGYRVTATDLSDAAIKKAFLLARKKRLNIDFVLDDILKCSLDARFDLVLDRGCFHVLDPGSRAGYINTVHGLVSPGGYLMLKCFSVLETAMQGGPYRFSPEDIQRLFGKGFIVASVKETVFHGQLTPLPKALFCVMKKV
ncbi:MAG: class I SAM-dependent methyltransferase [Deltaproteobacteria bacterium]|nr:class I SAM-dependent methyltransferase [Deltaproteobacteria bacterium]